jgi:Flp pilus assembly protein TadB
MRSHVVRLYVAAVAIFVFFVLWAVIAAKPWAAGAAQPGVDPRLVALDRRQRRLEHESRLVKQALDRRWRAYRARLRRREAAIRSLDRRHAQEVAAAAQAASAHVASGAPVSSAAARVVKLPPAVKVVTLPPAVAPSTSSGSSRP